MEEDVDCRFERTTDLRDLLKNPQFERYPLIMLMLTGFFTFSSFMLARILREHALLNFLRHGDSCLRNPIWRTFIGRFGPTALVDASKSIEKRRQFLKERRRLHVRWLLLGWTDKDSDAQSNEEGYVHKGELIWRVLLISCAIAFFCCLLNVAGGIGGKLPSLWSLTNLVNVQKDVSGVIPAHVMLGFLLTGSIFFTCLYHQLTTRTTTDGKRTTVLLRNVLPTNCDEETIKGVFGQHGLVVKSVEFVKNMTKLNHLESELSIYKQTMDRLSEEEKLHLVYPNWNSRIQVTKIDYYNQQVDHFQKEFDQAREEVAFSGALFVEFQSEKAALDAVKLFSGWSKFRFWLTSKFFRPGGHRLDWVVELAPNRSDINWDNLNAPVAKFYEARFITRWLAMVVTFAAGLTLPALIVERAGKTSFAADSALMKNVVLPQLKFVMNLLTLMLMVKIDNRANHITRTRIETGLMKVSFYFQIFSDLVFPMLKLSNFWALYRWIGYLSNDGDPWPRFECSLRPTYGIHVTRSIVAATTVRNVMMLLRIPQLIPELFTSLWCKSETEAALRLANRTITFDFGSRYAELLYQHAIAATCVIAHPLVTVFSVPCAILRHKVDQFCLRSVYAPTTREDSLHRQAFPLIFQPHLITSGTLVVFNVLRDAELGAATASALTIVSSLWFSVVCVNVVIGYLLAWDHTLFRMGDSYDDNGDLD